ncbi:MAG TPA: DUF1214 domain-containing protein [Mycobacterium sp.]|nr:DUF1214 domain-containing protein [Mycobacterium sp.]
MTRATFAPKRSARYIGGVGALAMGLGLGVALANSPGTALADTGKSGSATGSSSKGSTPTASPPDAAGKPSTISPSKPPPGAHPAQVWSRHGALPPTSALVVTPETAGSIANAVHTPAIAASTIVSPALTGPAGAQPALTHAWTQAAPPLAANAPAPAPAKPPATISSTWAGALLSAMGLHPHAANGPVGTPQPPALWVLLGWVRREVGTLSRSTPAINAVTAGATTSPLGTPDQIAAEKIAMKAVNTPVVKLAEIVLEVAWFLDAEKQFALVSGPDKANLAALHQAVVEYAMSAAMEQQSLDPNNPKVLELVMPPHTWYGETADGSRVLYDNPDTIYRFIPVNSASTYVITGQFTPGEVPADTNFSVLSGLGGKTVANLNGQDIVVAPDGSFTITVGSAAAAPGQQDYLQLPSNATAIIARNTLSDWTIQQPMSLSVTRVSGPPDSLFSQLGADDIPVIGRLLSNGSAIGRLLSAVPAFSSPPTALVATETAILMALGLELEPKYMAVATTNPATGQRNPPNVLSRPAHNATFLSAQLQSNGYFELNNDQALVITINPGNAGYFDVPVTNDWTITNNYWDQQTSLNNAQAIANADGTYTIVVSPTDPGVYNWVSTGGLNQGTLSIRLQDFNPNSTTTPTVSVQVVDLDQLSSVLPTGTVYVTAQQRQDQITTRQSGYNNRYAPYPQS